MYLDCYGLKNVLFLCVLSVLIIGVSFVSATICLHSRQVYHWSEEMSNWFLPRSCSVNPASLGLLQETKGRKNSIDFIINP